MRQRMSVTIGHWLRDTVDRLNQAQIDSPTATARMLLASTILSEGRVREAAAQAITAAAMPTDNADLASTMAHCLLRLGEMVAARDCLQRFDASKVR